MGVKRLLSIFSLAVFFTGVTFMLWKYPQYVLWIFPLYGLLFLLADLWKETEIQVIFVFLVTMAGVMLMGRANAYYSAGMRAAGIISEILIIWTAMLAISKAHKKGENAMREIGVEIQKHNKTINGLKHDLDSYLRHKEGILHQSQFESGLSEAIATLASAVNMDDVRVKLTNLLNRYFPSIACSIVAGAPKDGLENWALQRNVPLLANDIPNDRRFAASGGVPANQQTGEKSAIVVPLRVLQSVAGFIRLSSPKTGAFQSEDLRIADLLGTLTAVSMENLYLYNRVQELAIHDGLTQLFTHRAFQQRLQDEILRAGRSQAVFSLIIGDIDHFKHYNDTFGHQAGDLVLKNTAALLTRHSREVDCVARYGGEEFAVILPATDKIRAHETAQNFRNAVENEPFVFDGRRTKVTMSFGVASFPHDATTASQLVRSADERLYRSKAGGRNCVTSE